MYLVKNRRIFSFFRGKAALLRITMLKLKNLNYFLHKCIRITYKNKYSLVHVYLNNTNLILNVRAIKTSSQNRLKWFINIDNYILITRRNTISYFYTFVFNYHSEFNFLFALWIDLNFCNVFDAFSFKKKKYDLCYVCYVDVYEYNKCTFYSFQ